MKRSRPKPLTPEERQEALEFRESINGKLCAVCGLHQFEMEPHHVVEKQELKRRHLRLYDPRNALALCSGCHEAHTNASRRVPFRKLRPENIEYAYAALGPYAHDYLRRFYPMGDE